MYWKGLIGSQVCNIASIRIEKVQLEANYIKLETKKPYKIIVYIIIIHEFTEIEKMNYVILETVIDVGI